MIVFHGQVPEVAFHTYSSFWINSLVVSVYHRLAGSPKLLLGRWLSDIRTMIFVHWKQCCRG